MNKLKQLKEEVEKGCKKEFFVRGKKSYPEICGLDKFLCLNCKAKLQIIKQCQKIFEEMIDDAPDIDYVGEYLKKELSA